MTGVVREFFARISPRRRTRTYDTLEIANLSEYFETHSVPVGTIVTKISDTEPGPGWVRVMGQELSKADFPQLYEDIGGTFGETATHFSLPDLSDSYIVGAGVLSSGQTGGQNSTTLTVDQLPSHGHSFTGTPHNHAITDPGHSHTISDPGHSHSSVDGSGAVQSGTGGAGAAAGTTGSATTGISIDQATTGISIADTSAGGTVGDTGSGQEIDNRPKSLALYYFIKTQV